MDPHRSSTRHLAQGGSLFAATQSFGDSIALLDLAERPNRVVVATITVGTAPWGIAFDAESRRAYVATAEGVAVVDVDRRVLERSVSYRDQPSVREFGEYRPGGTGIVVTPDGGRVYVGVHRRDRFSTVEILDVASATIVGSLDVGERPFDVQISPDGRCVYSIDHDSFTVHTIDTGTAEVRRTLVAPFGTEGGHQSHQKLHYAAVADDGTLYMPFQGRGLVTFDPSDASYFTESMTGDTHQHGTSLTDDGRLLVVGVGPIGGATGGASLTIRTLDTGAEIVLPLDRGHENVVPWRDPVTGRHFAVLTGGSTSRNPWDGLTLVDLETLDTSMIPVPGRPQQMVPIG
ncbi:MAG: hypothetical protein JWR01_659 [Subtercola sp.]|nr:hypothetical protein [Subtercola sp.]